MTKYNLYEAKDKLSDVFSSIEMIYTDLVPKIQSKVDETQQNLLYDYVNIFDNKNTIYTIFIDLDFFEENLSRYKENRQFVMYDAMISFI